MNLPERRDNSSMSVHGDGGQSKHTDVDAQRLHERTEWTHEVWQQPSLEQRGLELFNKKQVILKHRYKMPLIVK